MDIGMIGLGRMGAGLARRLLRAGHGVSVYDLDTDAAAAVVGDGATLVTSVGEMIERMARPRVVWVMVPASVTGRVIDEVAARLGPGDVIVDGGNSFYRDDVRRSADLEKQGIHLVDVGTSGGVHGEARGFSLMIGGDEGAVSQLEPIFDTLAPGIDAASRTPGRSGIPSRSERGYFHCGPSGAGHLVKMVHNGIE